MPLAPTPLSQPPTNPNGVSDRLAAPAKQASSLTPTKWPLLGQSVYLKLARAAHLTPEEAAAMNPTLQRLAHAKNKLWQATQAYHAAMRETKSDGATPNAPVYNRLERQVKQLEKAMLEFPLEVR